MARIVDAFEISSIDYLETRKKWNSLAELKAQTTIKFPNGYEAWCEKEQCKYVLKTSNPDDISTYSWKREEIQGAFEIELNEQMTSDYNISINTDSVASSYDKVYKDLYQQFTAMFNSLQETIDKQQARINDLESRVFALEQGTVRPVEPTDETSIIDYDGDILVDYNGNAIEDYSSSIIEDTTVIIVDYDGDTLADYDDNILSDYSSTIIEDNIISITDYNNDILIDYDGNTLTEYTLKTPETTNTIITDYNGNTLADYNGYTLTDYTVNNVIYLSDYSNNNLVDYDNNYIIEKEG